jgi:hypothetical protein
MELVRTMTDARKNIAMFLKPSNGHLFNARDKRTKHWVFYYPYKAKAPCTKALQDTIKRIWPRDEQDRWVRPTDREVKTYLAEHFEVLEVPHRDTQP